MNRLCSHLYTGRVRGALSSLALLLTFSLLIASAAHSAEATLEWDGEDDARVAGYKVYYGTSSGSYTSVADAGNATRYTVTGLDVGTTYFFVVTAYDAAGSESGPSGEVQHTAAVSAGDGSDGGGGGGKCFIATAAFGSPLAPEVRTLRDFRDSYLLTNGPGRTFVHIYYALSPALADVVRQHEALRAIARTLLVPFIYGAKHPRTMAMVVSLMVMLAGLTLWRVLRRCPKQWPHDTNHKLL